MSQDLETRLARAERRATSWEREANLNGEERDEVKTRLARAAHAWERFKANQVAGGTAEEWSMTLDDVLTERNREDADGIA